MRLQSTDFKATYSSYSMWNHWLHYIGISNSPPTRCPLSHLLWPASRGLTCGGKRDRSLCQLWSPLADLCPSRNLGGWEKAMDVRVSTDQRRHTSSMHQPHPIRTLNKESTSVLTPDPMATKKCSDMYIVMCVHVHAHKLYYQRLKYMYMYCSRH